MKGSLPVTNIHDFGACISNLGTFSAHLANCIYNVFIAKGFLKTFL